MKRIILASASPRRKEIFEKTGLAFETKESSYEEDMSLKMPPEKLAEHLAEGKARIVAEKNPGALVIAADTFIVCGKRKLGKPKTPGKAKEMLGLLNGKEHRVITGVAIIDGERSSLFHEETKVFFKKNSPETINAYVRTGEPLDKAGAYAVQGLGAVLIKKIDGDFFNVFGLPLSRLVEELKKFSIKVL